MLKKKENYVMVFLSTVKMKKKSIFVVVVDFVMRRRIYLNSDLKINIILELVVVVIKGHEK